MRTATSFTGANFTGFLGERFRFQTLDDNGEPMGPLLAGEVKRVFRQGAANLRGALYPGQALYPHS